MRHSANRAVRLHTCTERTAPSLLSTTLRSVDTGGFQIREHQVIGRPENARHSHDYQCIGFLISGLGTAEFGRDQWMVHPGDLNIIPVGVPHAERFGTHEIRWCGIECPLPREEYAREARQVFDHPVQIKGGPANRIAVAILHELRLADKNSALALNGLALELLAVLARKAREPGERRPSWLVRAEEYLRARFLDSVSLNEIAIEVGVHPMHLAREFRRRFGMSVGAFVRNLRVDYAILRLADQDLPLARVASMTGFSDQAHFTRVFKQKVGVTPGAFRSSRR